MIAYVKYNDIHREKWDACIAHSTTPLVYGTSMFLDIVSPGWDGLVMNDYEAVFPLTHNLRWGFSYLRQPFFCQQLGIFSSGEANKEIVEEFFLRIPARFRFANLNLNTAIAIPPVGYDFRKNLNLELPLQKSYPEIFKYFSNNTKRNIRKASNAGLKMNRLNNPESLITMFMQNKGKEIKPLPEKAWQTLKQIIAQYMHKQTGQLWGVHDREGSLCAGAFFLTFGKRAVFLFSALNQKGRDLGAMFFLLNEFIQQKSANDIILDFEGSNDENLARFYKGFGAKEKYYLSIWKNNLPFPLGIFIKKPW